MTQPRTTPNDRPLHLLGDDLSGVAEAASVLARSTGRSAVISLNSASDHGRAQIVCRDLDTRRVAAPEAQQRTADALGLIDGDGPVLFKIDSLLRGNIQAHLQALSDSGLVAVLAPALPSAGRTVVDGVPMINGTPLAEASDVDAWRYSGSPAPKSLLELTGAMSAVVLPLETIRSDVAFLAERMEALMAKHPVIVCDAETDDDLDRIVAALDLDVAVLDAIVTEFAAGSSRAAGMLPVGLVGSAGLVAAYGRFLARRPGRTNELDQGAGAEASPVSVSGSNADALSVLRSQSATAPSVVAAPIIFVVGSTESGVRTQIAHLLRDGAVAFEPGEPGGRATQAERVRTAVTSARVVVLQAPAYTGSAPTPAAADALAALAAETLAGFAEPIDLVATGGETARRVLGALGVASLRVCGEVHHGAVVSTTESGALVVTRPGSFGESDSFLRIRNFLQQDPRARTPWTPRKVNDNV